jgi:hypothetical protein
LIGHHVLPLGALKEIQKSIISQVRGRINLVEFCRLRCPECEKKAHKNPDYVWGNSPEEQERVLAYLAANGRAIRPRHYKQKFNSAALRLTADNG